MIHLDQKGAEAGPIFTGRISRTVGWLVDSFGAILVRLYFLRCVNA